jgi:type VI protein secretion system component VasF
MQGASNSTGLDRVGMRFWAALFVWVALAVAVQYVFAFSGLTLVLAVLVTGVATALASVPVIRGAYRE